MPSVSPECFNSGPAVSALSFSSAAGLSQSKTFDASEDADADVLFGSHDEGVESADYS